MRLAYFRKSNFDFETTLYNLKEELNRKGLTLMGEFNLDNFGKVLNVCNSEWVTKIIENAKDFIGLLPCLIVIFKKNDEIFVGVGNPSLIGEISDNSEIIELAQKIDLSLKKIVDNACGVGPLKIKSIKLYATTTCPYCKMEAAWLDENKIKYEIVYVDINPRAAEEMVRKTGQMGVPVTEIIFENGDVEYVIGFDKYTLQNYLFNK